MKLDPQADIFRHAPAKMAEAYRTAADTAERNPYLTPKQRAQRAREFRERAKQFEQRIRA